MTTSTQPNLDVELDIFSGRPNPHWPLPSNQQGKLQAVFKSRADVEPPAIPGLGYRGFIITNVARVPSLPPQVRVFNHVVTTTDGDKVTAYRDTEGIESSLFALAREKGFHDVIERFQRGSSGPVSV